jgi:hypothetical protein
MKVRYLCFGTGISNDHLGRFQRFQRRGFLYMFIDETVNIFSFPLKKYFALGH